MINNQAELLDFMELCLSEAKQDLLQTMVEQKTTRVELWPVLDGLEHVRRIIYGRLQRINPFDA